LATPDHATISVFDRSFHFGDSLYEVTRTYDGILFAFDEHLRRLHESARLARFGALPDAVMLHAMVEAACRAFFLQFGNVDAYVRLTVSRGVGDLQIDRTTSGPPYAIVIVKEVAPRPPPGTGAHWALVDRRRNLPEALDPAMKSGNYLNNVLALAEAQALGADDGLMLDAAGWVTEGTTSNFFAVIEDCVWTAPLDVGILAGITREWILRVCADAGIEVRVDRFAAEDVLRARELFLSSSTREVQPIVRLTTPGGPPGGQAVAGGEPGPMTMRIAGLLRQFIVDWCQQHRAQSLFR